MKRTVSKKYLIAIVAALALTALGGCADEKAGVSACFNAYKSAILNAEGEKAADLVTAGTIAYYDRMLEHSRHGDSLELAGLSLTDRFIVLSTRHHFSPSEYLELDGKGYVALAIKTGLIAKETVEKCTIQDVIVTGGHAKARLVVEGKPTTSFYEFIKEEDEWKLDLVAVVNASENELAALVKKEGIDANAFIFDKLEYLTDERPTQAIWKPVVPR